MSDITPEYLTEIRVYPESVTAKAMCAIPVCGNNLEIFAEGTAFITADLIVGAAVIQAQAEALANLNAAVDAMRFVDSMSQSDEPDVEPEEETNVVALHPPLDTDESTTALLTAFLDETLGAAACEKAA
jgi:hypothetical protein